MMKKLAPLSLIALVIVLFACKSKAKKSEETSVFPVLSFIKGQVNHVDTSLYQVMQLTYVDSTRIDTEYVRREDFRALAKDFLELPDLADEKYNGHFKEDRIMDMDLGRVIITYEPVDPKKELVQRQTVLVIPSEGIGTMDNVMVSYYSETKDSSVEKEMMWKVDQYFKVRTIKQLPGKPESITTTKVVWNEHSDQ